MNSPDEFHFRLLPGREEEDLIKFKCLLCVEHTVVTDTDKHALYHGLRAYAVYTAFGSFDEFAR